MIEAPVTEERRGLRDDDVTRERKAAVEAELAQVCGLANATMARLVELMAGVLRTGDWCQAGIRSPEHYLMWQCALSRGDARRVLCVARRLGAYPRCAAAFAAGELSFEQAHIICSCAPPVWAEEQTCRFAKQMTLQQLRQVLSRYSFPKPADDKPAEETEAGEADAGGAGGEKPEPEVREARLGVTADGGLHVEADLPVLEGAEVRQALVGCRDALFHQRHPDAEAGDRPRDVSWADAVVEMARRALDWDAAKHPRRSHHRVLWHHHIDPEGRPVLRAHQGGRVPEWLRRLILCDADVVPVTEINPHACGPGAAHGQAHGAGDDGRRSALRPDGTLDVELLAELAGGVPVSVGRAQRIAPERTRRLIEDRDGCCRVPGCTNRMWLRIHHITFWEDGGATDTANLVGVCEGDHQALHRGELHVYGNADDPVGLTFTDAKGRPIRAGARVVPPTSPHDQAAAAVGIEPGGWRHPIGEAMQHDNVYFNGDPRQADMAEAARHCAERRTPLTIPGVRT